MSNPRYFLCDGRRYDEKARNPLKRAVRDVFDDLTNSSSGVDLRGLKTKFNLTNRRFETEIKGRLEINNGTSQTIRFGIEADGVGRAVLKNRKNAKEFNAKRLEGIINFNGGGSRGAVAFNLRTIVPIKMCKDIFEGNFERAIAKIDFRRSTFTGGGAASGISSSQISSLFRSGSGLGGLATILI